MVTAERRTTASNPPRSATKVGVRDSKKGDASPILEFAPNGLAALVTNTKAGKCDNQT